MTTAQNTTADALFGATVKGDGGAKLGKVDQVFLDDATDRPEWVGVKTGLFGGHISLVPLQRGRWDGDTLAVPFDKDELKSAPHHDPDAALSRQDEDDLYRHYGMATGAPATEGHDVTGPTTDDAMTRSEERLHVGTEQRETGRARLRKHVVSEDVSTTVPVRHDEVTVEREPITDANRDRAMAGAELTEDEHEVPLREEHVVTSKETEPVERVRLGTETVTEDRRVDETVRKEEIEAEGTEGDGRHRR